MPTVTILKKPKRKRVRKVKRVKKVKRFLVRLQNGNWVPFGGDDEEDE